MSSVSYTISIDRDSGAFDIQVDYFIDGYSDPRPASISERRTGRRRSAADTPAEEPAGEAELPTHRLRPRRRRNTEA